MQSPTSQTEANKKLLNSVKNIQIKLSLSLDSEKFEPEKLSKVIHDLKSDCAFLSNFANVLKDGYQLNDDRAPRFIERMDQAVKFIKSEVQELCKIYKQIGTNLASDKSNNNSEAVR
jgi:hypothetical protein